MEKTIKNYKQWMGQKAFINNKGVRRLFKEGDVWWAAVGENVGVEMDGNDYVKIKSAFIKLFL